MAYIKRTQEHTVDTLFILALFVVFAATSFIIVFIGAKQYQNIVDRMDLNFETRTCASYLEEKFHQGDLADSISITSIDGTDALALTQTVSGTDYTTYIYAYDGSIREILVAAGTDFAPADGQTIIEASALTVETVRNSLFKITVTDSSGNLYSIYLNQQSKN